jgi:hypothetical protein
MSIASGGARRAVDREQQVDFARLRSYRLGRTKRALAHSELGARLGGEWIPEPYETVAAEA